MWLLDTDCDGRSLYWMTHFDGWEDTWASFDDATVAAFRKQTGLDARHDLNLCDYSDPIFRLWSTTAPVSIGAFDTY
jgi:hypothetical protein